MKLTVAQLVKKLIPNTDQGTQNSQLDPISRHLNVG
jgi:hypothetical protein